MRYSRVHVDAIGYELPPNVVSSESLEARLSPVYDALRLERGQIRAGLVVSCESAREIVDLTAERLLRDRSMEAFKYSLATLTGGSGAVAVLLSDGSFSRHRRRLLGGVSLAAPEFHRIC